MNKIFYIDLFSGAGGTTTGVHNAGLEVVACVNHDIKAIESHKENHPQCKHFIEDVRNHRVVLALEIIVKRLRKENPDCTIVLGASLECTNYSKAKGGQPRDADSRTLGRALYMRYDPKKKKYIKGDSYIQKLKPDLIMIENVREFMSWGALDKNGRPISKLKGIDYMKWVRKINSLGYNYDWRLLNAADFGSYQSRERYFGQFAKKGMPIAWPEPTHSKNPEKQGTLFGSPLEKWKPVREVLDLKDTGNSMFDRPKEIVDATWKRAYAGMIKFIAGGEKEFLQKNYSGDPRSKVQSLDRPSGTITTIDHHSLIQPMFLTSYYGNGGAHSIKEPCPTLTCKDRFAAINPQFIDNQYGKGYPTSIDNPNGALSTIPKQNLVTCENYQYLMNPQFNDKGRALDRPCFTLIAKMDKRPPYLISPQKVNSSFHIKVKIVSTVKRKRKPVIVTSKGNIVYFISIFDSPHKKKVLEFMALYRIVDMKMRMLKIPELLQIQGFPKNYILKGTQAQQKKFIGNAVDTNAAEALARSTKKSLDEHFKLAA